MSVEVERGWVVTREATVSTNGAKWDDADRYSGIYKQTPQKA
jgi:hypothetical protein